MYEYGTFSTVVCGKILCLQEFLVGAVSGCRQHSHVILLLLSLHRDLRPANSSRSLAWRRYPFVLSAIQLSVAIVLYALSMHWSTRPIAYFNLVCSFYNEAMLNV